MRRKRVLSLLMIGMLTLTPVMEAAATGTEQTKEAKSSEGAKEDSQEDAADEEQKITTLEDANETLDSYADEETEWQEIYIKSVEDLEKFSRSCWLDTWSQNKKVYLTQDLNLAGSDFVSIPTFGGYFNGQGHTISGLSIKEEVSYTGLFCYTQRTAVIAELNVEGTIRPSGKQMVVGGIVGNNAGIIMDCSFKGTVEGNDYTGGITGFNEQTGIIINCKMNGRVGGLHYTGGIAGENVGNIVGCENEAQINTSNEDKGMSLDEINLEQYTNELLDIGGDGEKSDTTAAINSSADTGGIAGLSTGIIQHCTNKGTVGYEHVGYNVGGIAGCQSGYIYASKNVGTVYGRKDVGGIVGQAEPYIAVDLSEDIAYQLMENINTLHDLIDKMLDDAGTESETISGRLTVIQSFADKALDDTQFLADRTVEWADGMVGAVNDTVNRLDFIMDESAKEGGVIDQTRSAAGNVKDAAEDLAGVVDALDIYQYMTDAERQEYDNAKEGVKNASEEYSGYYSDMTQAYYNYYIDTIRKENKYASAMADLYPCVNDGSGPKFKTSWTSTNDASDYVDVEYWAHLVFETEDDGSVKYDNGEPVIANVYELGKGQSPDSAQNDLDRDLISDATTEMQNNSSAIAEDSENYADRQYRAAHGNKSYTSDVQDYVTTMSDIIAVHTSEMSEDARKEAEKPLTMWRMHPETWSRQAAKLRIS